MVQEFCKDERLPLQVLNNPLLHIFLYTAPLPREIPFHTAGRRASSRTQGCPTFFHLLVEKQYY